MSALAAACMSAFLTLGLGLEGGADPNHYGDSAAVTFRLACEFDDRWSVEWDHHSDLLQGYPFASHDRNTSDTYSVLYRIRLK